VSFLHIIGDYVAPDTADGHVYPEPYIEIDTAETPDGYVDLVIHQHGPDHPDHGAALASLRLTRDGMTSLGTQMYERGIQ
jgi:hypothetical protein